MLFWTYEEKQGPALDSVIRSIKEVLPDGVHAYGAIKETAENVLGCFDEDAH